MPLATPYDHDTDIGLDDEEREDACRIISKSQRDKNFSKPTPTVSANL